VQHDALVSAKIKKKETPNFMFYWSGKGGKRGKWPSVTFTDCFQRRVKEKEKEGIGLCPKGGVRQKASKVGEKEIQDAWSPTRGAKRGFQKEKKNQATLVFSNDNNQIDHHQSEGEGVIKRARLQLRGKNARKKRGGDLGKKKKGNGRPSHVEKKVNEAKRGKKLERYRVRRKKEKTRARGI